MEVRELVERNKNQETDVAEREVEKSFGEPMSDKRKKETKERRE